MADDRVLPVFVDENNLENLVTCTGKTETTTGKLLHGADEDKVQFWKETFSKCKVHTRKSDGNDSSYNSYEASDSNFIADENLTKICLLFTWYNHCVVALQFYWSSQVKGRAMSWSITCVVFIFWSWNFAQRFLNCFKTFHCPNSLYGNKEFWV